MKFKKAAWSSALLGAALLGCGWTAAQGTAVTLDFRGKFPDLGPIFQTRCSLTYDGTFSPRVAEGANCAEAKENAINACKFWTRSLEACRNGKMVCTHSMTKAPLCLEFGQSSKNPRPLAAVLSEHGGPATAGPSVAERLRGATEALARPISFDGAAAHKGSLVLVQGPPGSGGGPPGSGRRGPPGSGRRGPPGSGNPSRPGGPPGGTPPSRPAPIWRDFFPAPAPNWWNTRFDHYDWWESLPFDYNRPRNDQLDADTFLYYSGWSRWRDVFTTDWEKMIDTASIIRTQANQDQVHTRSLASQSYRESKECYYQAVYLYNWAQGGIYGSHWEENFERYNARCIRLPREYGPRRVYTAHVSFNMNLVAGQDLPWESDVIGLSYDGFNRPSYNFTGAAYKYGVLYDDHQPKNSERVTLVAQAKIPRAPETDKVQAFLRLSAGKVEFVINDDRASYYQGETLRVNAKVIRRVVIKVKGMLWGWNEKNVDTLIHDSPLDIVVAADKPQSVTDLTKAAGAPKPADAVRSSVFIEYWNFQRVNSRISTDDAIRRGRGNSIDY